jgi:peptide/nickel transport system substrate-binding protein
VKGKLWTVLAVMVILSLGLAACGPAPTEAPPPTPAPAEETPTAAPAAVEVEDEWGVVKVAQGDPILVGFAAGLSGAGIDVLGLDEQRGAELAVKDKPEILGFPVELQVEDEQCSAEGGQTVATKLVANPQIVALVGHMCSSSCTPASKVYEQNGYTMVSPSCTAPSLTNPDLDGTTAFFRTCWNDKIQGPAAAKFVYETLGLTKAATIHDGSPYAEQLGQEFTKGFEALGGEVVAAEAVNVGDTDMRPVLTRIKAAGPELIYWSGFVAEGGYLATQMPDVGMEDVIFMGADGIKADEFIKAAGDRAEGVYASAGNPAEAGADLPKFLEAYKAEYGEDPIAPFHAQAYDAYMVIANAIEKVGQVDADGNLLIGRKALNDAVRGTTGYQGLSGTISCDENGDCGAGSVAVSMVQGGQWVAAEAPAAPAAEEALIIGTTDTVTDLDPAETYDFHTWEIFYNVGGGLLNYIPGTTDLEPQLAAEWPTVSDDGLEWTFKLLPDMVFPDGTPLDANAVKWSLDRVVRLEGDPNWLVSSFLDEVIVVDDLTLTVKLQNPVGFFPYLTAITPWYPVSPNCYSEDGFDSDSTCSGLGPYKITRWERDVEMEMEANPDYPGDPPKWSKIIVRYFADATTMRLALENGEIDVAWKTLLPTDYIDLEENPNVVVIEGPGAYIRYICFNSTTPPFDNPIVKQAISLAIDRVEISDRVYLGTHQPLYSMVPMGMKGHIDAFPERDLEAAKALLAEAGYSEASPLEMDLWWTPAHYGDTEADVATVLKANLEETGMIKVSLQSAEWATYTDYFGPGTMPVFLLGWYPDYLDPDNYTWSFAHSEAADDLGIFYANEEMDELLEAAQTETDMDARMDLYAQIQELWVTECPTVPFTQGSLYAVTQKNVTGITLAPNMYLPYFLLEK